MKQSASVTSQTKVAVVNNGLEVREKLEEFKKEGYLKENLYVLTHNDERTKHISEKTDASEIGFLEEGPINAIANLFRSKGNELRAKLRSMGVSKEEAEGLESEMDKGKVIVLAWSGMIFTDGRYDPNIMYYRGPYL